MAKNQKSYQQLKAELDEIIQAIDAPDLDVDQAIELYQQGQKLVIEIQNYLEKAQNRVTELKAEFNQNQR